MKFKKKSVFVAHGPVYKMVHFHVSNQSRSNQIMCFVHMKMKYAVDLSSQQVLAKVKKDIGLGLCNYKSVGIFLDFNFFFSI